MQILFKMFINISAGYFISAAFKRAPIDILLRL